MYLQSVTVGILGGYGSFHHQAAMHFFGSGPMYLLHCDTFTDLVQTLEKGEADYVIMAVENTIAGPVPGNYDLIAASGATKVGELSLRIQQQLLVLPGTALEDITEIHSHPVAIRQCQEFLKPFEEKGVSIIHSFNTALSAQYIRINKLKNVAAIASRDAASLYELDIIAQNIESSSGNYTKFLCLGKHNQNHRIAIM